MAGGGGGSCLRRSSLFSLYAKVFRVLLTRWERGVLQEVPEQDDYTRELERLVLPSDEAWRLGVYYRLVDLQRGAERPEDGLEDAMQEERRAVQAQPRELSKPGLWDLEEEPNLVFPLKPRGRQRLTTNVAVDGVAEPGWHLRDILLAANLFLARETIPYADEAEMRRTFGLIYDVLRHVLDRALDDTGFWNRNAQLQKNQRVVWLLLYDLHGRKFSKVLGTAALAQRNDGLQELGILDIEKALLATRTRLAASLSRLRIGGGALTLEELLPAHLRTAEGVKWGDEGALASGWMNSAKLPSRQYFIDEMKKLGLILFTSSTPSNDLCENQYVFDPILPQVVILHDKAREKLALSDLVKNNSFIFLERSLCVGAATLVRAIKASRLCGPVILTHSTAPRHTAYLASLLNHIEDVGRLLVFSTGASRTYYEFYLEKLGLSSKCCRIYSERFECAPSTAEIERATLVLAMPPCSYTGVHDVVDLAIARNGDLSLLESLTSQEAEAPQQPHDLLVEQMLTLSTALTRPNVQLLVYQVHTHLPAETTEMVERAIEHANRLAIDKFLIAHPIVKKSPSKESSKKSKRKRQSVDQATKTAEQPSADQVSSNSDQLSRGTNDSLTTLDYLTDKSTLIDVEGIPDSDLFEQSSLNSLFERDCGNLVHSGAFVVAVRRKEMMQFNSQFMIKVAEAKGVFGDTGRKPVSSQIPEPPAAPIADPMVLLKKSRRFSKTQLEKLSAQTHASWLRGAGGKDACPRYQERRARGEDAAENAAREVRRSDARRWWEEVARHWSRARSRRFRALRTDPVSGRILFPTRVTPVTYVAETPGARHCD